MAVQETFGGEVFELHITEKEIHFYTIIGGEIIDLKSDDCIYSETKQAARFSDHTKTVLPLIIGLLRKKRGTEDGFRFPDWRFPW